jgi:Zn-dependent protease
VSNVRPLRQSVRPSPVFLAIVAITAAGGVVAWLADRPGTPLSYVGVFVFVVFGWLVSLCLHEFGHAYTAWRYGDRDVEIRGYLTLNPLKYSNPLLSLGIPGPFVNVVLAIVLLVMIRTFFDSDHLVFWAGVAFLAFLQVTAVLLNLLPIPGLDGYGALEPHLKPETQRQLAPAKQWGFLILFVLLMAPMLNQWFFGLVTWFFELSGTPGVLWQIGGGLTRFWSAWF